MKKNLAVTFLMIFLISCNKPAAHIYKITGKQLHIKDSLPTDSI